MTARLATRDNAALATIAIAAGLAGLALDVPAASAALLAIVALAVMAYLVTHPSAWIAWFLGAGLLAPPVAFELAGAELPLHPAMLVLAAGCFVAFVRLPEWRVERSAITTASLALCGALAISLPWAFYYSGAGVGAQSTLRWALLLSGFIVLAYVAYGPAINAPALLRMILAAAFLTSVFAILDFQFQLPRSARFSDQYIYLSGGQLRRAQGVFYDSSALGNFCAMILTLILALGRRAREEWRIPAWLLWLPVPPLAVALVLSFSRGSMVNLAVALCALAYLRGRALVSRRTIIAFIVLTVVVAGAALVVAPEFLALYGSRWENTALEFFSRPNDVLSKRLDTWRELADFIADNPLQVLLGIGYKSLPYTDYFPRALTADNMYLSLLIECGIAGVLALFAFCYAVLKTTLRLTRDSNEALAGLARFLFVFWLGEMSQMLSGDILTYWRVTPVYLALLGLAMRGQRE